MLRKISVIAILILSFSTSKAQDSTKAEKKSNFTFSGFIDAYLRADFKGNVANNRTSFTNSTGSLALGMASFKIDYAIKKLSLTADLGVGKRAKEFAYNDKGLLSGVKQLYASYIATDWIKFTAGTWATHLGYEIVDPFGNRNYSMAYMFSYGPFLHTGIKSDLTFGKSGVMVGVSNPTDYRKAPTGSKPAMIFQYSYAFSDNVKTFLNYVGGKRPSDTAKVNQFDIVFTAKLSNKFNVAYNGTINSSSLQNNNKYQDAKSWGGTAVYLNYDPTSKLGITLRTEIFNDKNQLSALAAAKYGSSIFANTISGNVKLGHFTIVPELRFESAKEAIFFGKNDVEMKNASSFVLAAYYKF
jgi:hypothetical protein